MQCRLCGGSLKDWLEMPIDAKKDELTQFKKLLRCTDCDTGMAMPQPTAEEVAKFYQLPSYYTHGESHIREVEPRIWDKLLTKLAWQFDRPKYFKPDEIARMLPPSGKICDLGCGHAALLKMFKEMGFSCVGVEPDPHSRDLAIASGIDVIPGTAETLPAELIGRQFDLVIMTHSLEHCIHPEEALANAFLLTKEGGYLYCEVPNCGCVHFETMNICSETFDLPRHLWFFTAAGLRRAIEKNGYTFDSWRFTGFTRHHLPGWRAWETTIFDRLAKRGKAKSAQRHTFIKSLSIFAKSALSLAERKYDCVGLIAKKQMSKCA